MHRNLANYLLAGIFAALAVALVTRKRRQPAADGTMSTDDESREPVADADSLADPPV